MRWISGLSVILVISSAIAEDKLPDDFEIGFGTSSYQVEGAWNEDGKGENIWDRLVHTTNLIVDNSTGDIACDSYHKYKEDVQMLKDVGANYYRFSLSWSRILPNGQVNSSVDYSKEKGVLYYKNFIKELVANGIKVMITLFHWDTPQPLEDIGGFTNSEIQRLFGDYARLCFQLFGDEVKLWSTFNEPMQMCQGGYGSANKAPAIRSPGFGEYLCAHNVILSHATAYHIYENEFRKKQKGKVSIVTDFNWFEPLNSTSKADQEAAERGRHFYYGWYINPIVFGNYPKVMIDLVGKKSKAQGFLKSRLPKFTKEERKFVKGTYDFLGVNHYSAVLTTSAERTSVGFQPDIDVAVTQDSNWEKTDFPFFVITPWFIRKVLNWIKDTYKNPEVYVTENGCADNGTLEDDMRVKYFKGYIGAVLDARNDGVNVKGYTGWSLMDNFEWFEGYTKKFGIYWVDFDSPNRTRVAKKSAAYMKSVIETRCLQDWCVV